MPSNMGFSMTTAAVEAEEKDVTRRLGWRHLKPGRRLWACEKAMGLKKGERIHRMKLIEVVSADWQPLNRLLVPHLREWALREMVREGFPHLAPEEFVEMFCRANHCYPHTEVNRIEFRYCSFGEMAVEAALADAKRSAA